MRALIAGRDETLKEKRKTKIRYRKFWENWGVEFTNPQVELTKDELLAMDNSNLIINLSYANVKIDWNSKESFDAWKSTGWNRMKLVIENAFEIAELYKRIEFLMPKFVSDEPVSLICDIQVGSGVVSIDFDPNSAPWNAVGRLAKKAHFWYSSDHSPYHSDQAVEFNMRLVLKNATNTIQTAGMKTQYMAKSQTELEDDLEDAMETAVKTLDLVTLVVLVSTLKYNGLAFNSVVEDIEREFLKNLGDNIAKLPGEYYTIIRTNPKSKLPKVEDLLNVDMQFIESFKKFWSNVYLRRDKDPRFDSLIRTLDVWTDDSGYKLINGVLFNNFDKTIEKLVNPKSIEKAQKLANLLQYIFFLPRLPKPQSPFIVTRGFWPKDNPEEQRGPNFFALKPGDIVYNHGFLPTSFDTPPDNFVGHYCCVMIIEVPANFPCIVIQSNSNVFDSEYEKEILFPAGTSMEFIKTELMHLNNSLMHVAHFKFLENPMPPQKLLN